MDEDFGLNLEDGIASENYRYYGQGLSYGECGLEIKSMKRLDRTQWRCFVGLMDSEDALKNIPEANKRVYKHSAVIDASDDWNRMKGIRNLIKNWIDSNFQFRSSQRQFGIVFRRQ